jgi:hypothetical protein
MKHVFLAFCIALPLTTLAAESTQSRRDSGAAAAGVQTASVDGHAAVRSAKERGSRMGACRQQASDQGLTGAEYKVALATCMKPAQ